MKISTDPDGCKSDKTNASASEWQFPLSSPQDSTAASCHPASDGYSWPTMEEGLSKTDK